MSAIKDDEPAVRPVKCSTCKHYIRGLECRAFDKIPFNIFTERTEHDKVLPNQKGTYIYEPK